jgi:RNA polymerase sigma-70 factor (ECF subfamily)
MVPQERRSGDDLDRALVGRFLARRDDRTFRELYRRHSPSLNRMIHRLVGSANGEAEDVVQTTWVRAIQRLDAFRWESSLRTWLTGIAVNCSRECLRRRGRDWTESAEGLDLAEPERIHREISPIDLERAIDGLPHRSREVLILHDVAGYTHAEIGELLGIESGTSKSQLSRARRAVRAGLGEPPGESHERASK